MGAFESKLYWSQTSADGNPRSLVSRIVDPVGACLQPADLSPFNGLAEETPAEIPAPPPAPPLTEPTPAQTVTISEDTE